MSTERWLFLGLLVFVALRACGVPAPVEAQDDEAMVVARVSFHESPAPIADAPGIYSVLRRGSERHGISLAAYARAYSPRLFAGTSARPWARMLAASCDRPSGYPLPWTEARRSACERLVAAARALVAGPPTVDATTWGSVADFRRAEARGRRFVFVDVPGARNRFAREVRP